MGERANPSIHVPTQSFWALVAAIRAHSGGTIASAVRDAARELADVDATEAGTIVVPINGARVVTVHGLKHGVVTLSED